MADSTVMDVPKLNIVDLDKELERCWLSYGGDKAELTEQIQTANFQDDEGDISLDSDEFASVLQDEDDNKHTDIPADSAVDTLREELLLFKKTAVDKSVTEAKLRPTPIKIRTEPNENTEDIKPSQNKYLVAKKSVLNRTVLIKSAFEDKTKFNTKSAIESATLSTNRVQIKSGIDNKARLELRAKRFGLPVKMSEQERKEARKRRFGQQVTNQTKLQTSSTLTEKLRKRAERFGQTVSKVLIEIEKKDKLEKRNAKFWCLA